MMYRTALTVFSMTALALAEGASPGETSDEGSMAAAFSIPVDDIRQRFVAIFEKIDDNGDKSVTQEEAVKWIVKLRDHVTAHSVKIDMKNLDRDGDDMVTLEEITLAMEGGDGAILTELQSRFEIVDKDKDGKLNLEELRRLVTGNDEELQQLEIGDIMISHDLDKDGKISVAEFMRFDEGTLEEEQKKQLQEEFDSMDTNKDGHLDPQELKKLVDTHSEEDFQKSVEALWTSLAEGKDLVSMDEMMGEKFESWVSSVLTDDGELVRFPESYDMDLPFKNIERPLGHGDLEMPDFGDFDFGEGSSSSSSSSDDKEGDDKDDEDEVIDLNENEETEETAAGKDEL